MSATIEKIQLVRIQTAMKDLSREQRLDKISLIVGREITTTKELNTEEAGVLINALTVSNYTQNNWAFFEKDKFVSERKLLFSYLHQAQWVKPHPDRGEVPDLERLSNFLKSPKSPVNKPLKKFEKKDWSKLIAAFRNIVKGTYK